MYIYKIDKAQLRNAGKYRCEATYSYQTVIGKTVSNEESIVILGNLYFIRWYLLQKAYGSFSAYIQLSPYKIPQHYRP